MKHIITVLTLFVSFSALSQNLDPELQKKIDEIVQSAKDAGSIDQPISEATKNIIDSSTKAQLDRKKPEGFYSTDCQNWKKIDLQKNQGELNLDKMFYKTLEGGFPSLFDIKKQTMFSYDQQKLFYIKIVSDAVTGLVNGTPVYREIDSTKIQNGLAGILQGIMLVAAEGSTSWLLTGKENSPRLLHMLTSEKSPALKDYISLICTRDAKCFLVSKNRASVELKLFSKEHVALKDAGIFSADRVNVFFRMCDTIDSKDFNADLTSEIRSFENSCNKKADPLLANKTKEKISSMCSELKYHILPMMKTYR